MGWLRPSGPLRVISPLIPTARIGETHFHLGKHPDPFRLVRDVTMLAFARESSPPDY
jgi:hypothetical protein